MLSAMADETTPPPSPSLPPSNPPDEPAESSPSPGIPRDDDPVAELEVLPNGQKKYVWQQRWFQVLLAAIVLLGVISFVVPTLLAGLYAIRTVLVPVLFGLALAYVFNPLLEWAQRKLKFSRLASTLTLLLISMVVGGAILLTAVPLLISQSQSLIQSVQQTYPKYLDQLLERIDPQKPEPEADTPGEVLGAVKDLAELDNEPATANEVAETLENPLVGEFINPERNRRLIEILRERLRALDMETVSQVAVQSLDIGVGIVGSAISLTTYLLLSVIVILFCFFFFSWKLDKIKAWFVPFIPLRRRERALEVMHQMDLAVSAFVRGRLVQSLIMMVVLIFGWWWVGVPYWFLLGVATGLMNLVPFLPVAGWLIAMLLTVMTGLADGEAFTWGLIIWPSVVYFAAQGLDGWLVEPVVQGKATNLDPLTVLLVVLIGGSVAGLLGLILAIPITACIKILAREVLLPELRKVAAES
jgi:predicted PurR-regulated permease PerM